MTIILPNLAMAGYRSFGENIQYFEKFSKVNLFIGQNNSGKSNVLNFIKEVLGSSDGAQKLRDVPLARHKPKSPPMLKGFIEEIGYDKPTNDLPGLHRLLVPFEQDRHRYNVLQFGLRNLTAFKAGIDGTSKPWSISNVLEPERPHESWLAALNTMNKSELQEISGLLTGQSGGDPRIWVDNVARRMSIQPAPLPVELIPAARQIIGGEMDGASKFDGRGLIQRLAKLQNPDDVTDFQRVGFKKITAFVQSVLNSPEATIEIPYSRDTIVVHMNGKALPFTSLGSGIHQVIILAAAATVLDETVVCIEEPEVHLNPVLQKKLIKYLAEKTNNQYFIATHSAALMDTEGAEIYHVRQSEGASIVSRVTSNSQRWAICEDLGYHPSDLIQTNCVIWVEGPSDRIYLNHWLKKMRPAFVEGLHYSIMFYGGILASHLAYEDIDEDIEEFISLRRLNQRGVILMDSDRAGPRKPFKKTTKRLEEGFSVSQGLAWITEGREIENYLPPEQIQSAISSLHKKYTHLGGYGKYSNCLKIRINEREFQASKVEVAKYIIRNFEPDFSILDLRKRVERLAGYIAESNKQKILD
ncbi:AAA family ATPase [Acidovorax sp. Root217]|uniref:AAA family ATPase n=1 Tax=Acidovorax sp. Root217 TaxID=1736492 RepID=UPI0009EA564C|nr:AAA family ATPase [Acidovorax sp. Root217]